MRSTRRGGSERGYDPSALRVATDFVHDPPAQFCLDGTLVRDGTPSCQLWRPARDGDASSCRMTVHAGVHGVVPAQASSLIAVLSEIGGLELNAGDWLASLVISL